MELEPERVRDPVALDRLRGAVQADHGRSAMIDTDEDLATRIGRCMEAHGAHLAVHVRPDGGLRFSDGDAAGWAAIQRAIAPARFD